MLVEEKIRLMTKLAIYEEKEGKREIPMARYYRSDYIGKALIKNFFLICIAYLLVLFLFGFANINYILDNIHKMNLSVIIMLLIGGFLILLVVYTVITYIYYSLKYRRSQKNTKIYDQNLKELIQMYDEEFSSSNMNETKEEV